MKADGVIEFAKQLIGRKYVLGAYVPKNSPTYKGAFDCAEFVAFVNFQVLGVLFGTELNNFSKKDSSDDAYTGYFDRDAKLKGIIIPTEQAIRTKGAMLLRVPTGSSIGHIALSQGTGETVEAYNSKKGVIESVTDNRRFDYGMLLPGFEYEESAPVISKAPAVVYRLKTPNMKGDFVGQIQRTMGWTVNYIYDVKTQARVVAFQKLKGLTPDGEMMPNGETARAMGIK